MMLLMSPHWPFSIQWMEMKVGIAGTAQGRMNTSISVFVPPSRAHEEARQQQCEEQLHVHADRE